MKTLTIPTPNTYHFFDQYISTANDQVVIKIYKNTECTDHITPLVDTLVLNTTNVDKIEFVFNQSKQHTTIPNTI